MDPIPIFALIRFFSFISFVVVITGQLVVNLGGGGGVSAISVGISDITVEFFYRVEINSNKKYNPKIKSGFWEVILPLYVNQISWEDKPLNNAQLININICMKFKINL